MRISITLIMNSKIRDHALGDELLLTIIADQFFIFGLRKLAWNRHDDPSGQLRVPLFFGFLHSVPEHLAVFIFREARLSAA